MRYKVGWFIPQQVMALTHFVPEVTQDDFMAIVAATDTCLAEAQQPFYMMIDNRIIKSEQVVSLEVILQTMPQLQASQLRAIIMVLPQPIRHQASSMARQQAGDIQLVYVENLAAGFAVLQSLDTSLKWALQLLNFFAEDLALTNSHQDE
jgi:hypothetical protein